MYKITSKRMKSKWNWTCLLTYITLKQQYQTEWMVIFDRNLTKFILIYTFCILIHFQSGKYDTLFFLVVFIFTVNISSFLQTIGKTSDLTYYIKTFKFSLPDTLVICFIKHRETFIWQTKLEKKTRYGCHSYISHGFWRFLEYFS